VVRAARWFRRRERVEARADRAHRRWEAERTALASALFDVEMNRSWPRESVARPLGFHVEGAERIYMVLDGAQLVEQRGLRRQAEYSGFSFRRSRDLAWNTGDVDDATPPRPGEPETIDRGVITITDRRVVFSGAVEEREWLYADGVEYDHLGSAPITMIRVSRDGGPSLGFRYNVVIGPLVHLRLATAIAYATGTQAELIASLRRELVDHDTRRPAPPAVIDLTSGDRTADVTHPR
jgi:hypothetical protein